MAIRPKKTRLIRMYERPGFLLRRAHQISSAIFENECGSLALTQAQFAVLSALRALPQIDQARLAKSLGYDKVTIMHVLRGMVERNLIVRQSGIAKGRSIALSLTKAGEDLLDQAQLPTERASNALLDVFSVPQRVQFLKLLKILNASLEDKARAPLIALSDIELP